MGTPEDPFALAEGHYNPDNCPHPYHAGDLPPLFGNKGIAWSAFLTDRFRVGDVIGKTVLSTALPTFYVPSPPAIPVKNSLRGHRKDKCFISDSGTFNFVCQIS